MVIKQLKRHINNSPINFFIPLLQRTHMATQQPIRVVKQVNRTKWISWIKMALSLRPFMVAASFFIAKSVASNGNILIFIPLDDFFKIRSYVH